MKRIFSLASSSIAAAVTNTESSNGTGAEVSTTKFDPEVVEFFKYFPEPYRQNAIERYSKREGWHRWKIFRYMDMEEEKHSALNGIFLEDVRKAEELSRLKREEEKREAYLQKIQDFHARDIPEWEHRCLQYIPLQPGETMKWKLGVTAFASTGGLLCAFFGFRCLKIPNMSRAQAYCYLFIGISNCICIEVLTYCKLMNLSFFDQSVDSRDAVEKLGDELKKSCKQMFQAVVKSSSRP